MPRSGLDPAKGLSLRPRRLDTTGAEAHRRASFRDGRRRLTNREIAQQLFVTVKAVQWHLGNTYRKLEISSREELARELG